MCNNGIPSIKCVQYQYDGKNDSGNITGCSCELGFIVHNYQPELGSSISDPFVCVDEDECQVLGPDLCSQHCVNTFGSYKCLCSDGYHLSDDGHTCKAYGSSMVFVFSNGTALFLSNHQTQTPIITQLSNANDLAMEHEKNLIYWSDPSSKRIQRGAVIRPAPPAADLTEDVVNIDLVAPNALTIDWIRRLLFWADGGRQLIEVMHLETRYRKAIVWEDIVRPRDIICHPKNGVLFWAEWGNRRHKPRVERINMDGTDATIIAYKQVYRPVGLVIDFATDKLYWIDAEKLTLESSDLNGRHRTYIVPEHRNSIIQPPYKLEKPMATAIFEDFAYISDQGQQTMYQIRRHPLPREIGEVVIRPYTNHNYGQIGPLLIFHNNTQPNFDIKTCHGK